MIRTYIITYFTLVTMTVFSAREAEHCFHMATLIMDYMGMWAVTTNGLQSPTCRTWTMKSGTGGSQDAHRYRRHFVLPSRYALLTGAVFWRTRLQKSVLLQFGHTLIYVRRETGK